MEKVLRDLNDGFRQYTGTQHYYRGLGLNYTDGIKGMADKFGAYWLTDVVGSYQTGKTKKHSISNLDNKIRKRQGSC